MTFKKRLLGIILIAFVIFSSTASADVAVRDRVITLGADLNDSQKTRILNVFQQDSKDIMVAVTHEDEVIGFLTFVVLSLIQNHTAYL